MEALQRAVAAEELAKGLVGGQEATPGAARESVKTFEAALLAAKVAAEEEDKPAVMRECLARVEGLERSLAGLRLGLRDVEQRAASEKAKRASEERASLLSSAQRNADGNGAAAARREMLDQAAQLDKSRGITATLRRIKQMVQMEVDRMAVAQQYLARDADALNVAKSEDGEFKSAAESTNAALKEYQRQEKLDKIAIVGGFAFFLAVVIYIIWKRTIGWVL